jgi:hypothetical protein
LVSDGLPILMIWDIIHNLRRCNKCTTDVFEKDLDMHFSKYHPGARTPDPKDLYRSFPYVISIPGFGHYLWNNLRAVINLYWNTVFEKVAKLMGYRTEKALLICKTVPDLHKGWDLFIATYHSLALELIEVFVRKRIEVILSVMV